VKVGTSALLGFSLTLGACKKDKNNDAEVSLYSKLGGSTMVADPDNARTMIEQGRLGLRSVVDSTIFVIAGTPSLQPYFASLLSEVGAGNMTGFAALSGDLTDFFSVATGSTSASYTGLSMAAAHVPALNSCRALKSDNAAYDAFVGAVVTGAQKTTYQIL
jgi:hypothetical protein